MLKTNSPKIIPLTISPIAMIYAQGVVFFTAGFETTSNSLTTLSYNLAKHPDIQVLVASLTFTISGPCC